MILEIYVFEHKSAKRLMIFCVNSPAWKQKEITFSLEHYLEYKIMGSSLFFFENQWFSN